VWYCLLVHPMIKVGSPSTASSRATTSAPWRFRSGAGGNSLTVVGSAGDTVTGSAVATNTQLIDASGVNPSAFVLSDGEGRKRREARAIRNPYFLCVGNLTRRISITGYFELVLGEWRHANLMHVVTETEPHTGSLLARNAYGRAAADRVVAVNVSESSRTVTGSRTEFIGRNGTLADPDAMRRVALSGRTGAGLDPCAALQTRVEIEAGCEREVVFTLAAAGGIEEARALSATYCTPSGARAALEAVWAHWNHTLGAIRVETPDPALDVLANGWLVYQTLSCRYWGRSGAYQSGGAYGFRDQLQDTMALVHAAPALAREHLIRCAGRQFTPGDVQHWWHPGTGHGVRTHFSDDFLWLPFAACHYVEATGDDSVLDLQVPFLEGRAVDPDEAAYYDNPQVSTKEATVYEHCVRAINHGLRFGEHGLPLMGCGDWNDGMDLVGRGGKGESVWLAWFLYRNLRQFAELARKREDHPTALSCDDQAEGLRRNIEAHAWDGAWYRRAYFDDGFALGSATNRECRIDSIAQAWAVISGVGRSADAFWRWFAKTSRHTAATAAKACPSVRWLRRMAPGAVGATTVTTPWCAAATRGQAGWNPGVEQSRRDHRPGGEKATCGSLVHGHRAAGLPTLSARTCPRQVPRPSTGTQ
jgi:hypothetical protein